MKKERGDTPICLFLLRVHWSWSDPAVGQRCSCGVTLSCPVTQHPPCTMDTHPTWPSFETWEGNWGKERGGDAERNTNGLGIMSRADVEARNAPSYVCLQWNSAGLEPGRDLGWARNRGAHTDSLFSSTYGAETTLSTSPLQQQLSC